MRGDGHSRRAGARKEFRGGRRCERKVVRLIRITVDVDGCGELYAATDTIRVRRVNGQLNALLVRYLAAEPAPFDIKPMH